MTTGTAVRITSEAKVTDGLTGTIEQVLEDEFGKEYAIRLDEVPEHVQAAYDEAMSSPFGQLLNTLQQAEGGPSATPDMVYVAEGEFEVLS